MGISRFSAYFHLIWRTFTACNYCELFGEILIEICATNSDFITDLPAGDILSKGEDGIIIIGAAIVMNTSQFGVILRCQGHFKSDTHVESNHISTKWRRSVEKESCTLIRA